MFVDTPEMYTQAHFPQSAAPMLILLQAFVPLIPQAIYSSDLRITFFAKKRATQLLWAVEMSRPMIPYFFQHSNQTTMSREKCKKYESIVLILLPHVNVAAPTEEHTSCC